MEWKFAETSVRLRPVAPFRLDLCVWALRRSPANTMDRWDGGTYRRVLVTEDRPVAIAVVQIGPQDAPELRLTFNGAGVDRRQRDEIIGTVNKMLGLDLDLAAFYRLASKDKLLAALTRRFAGLKPPRLPTVFETFVNGVACQQLSLNVCLLILNRLCTRFGLSVDGMNAFPRPADLAGLKPVELKKLGFSGRKAEYILNMVDRSTYASIDLEALADRNDDDVMSSLLALRGIGRWTAEYIMLRGLGRLNALPSDDVGIQNKLKVWLNLDRRPSSQAVREMFPQIAPFRGLIYFYLLLDYLGAQGLVRV